MSVPLKKYPSYKDSGIEWLGEIPEHWVVKKLKHIGYFNAGCGFPDTYQGEIEGDLPFYKVADMTNVGNDVFMSVANNYITFDTAKELHATIMKKESIIFAKVGAALLLNRRRILTTPSCIDNNLMNFEIFDGFYKYFYYWLLLVDFGEISNPGAVPSINEKQLKEILVLHINYTEQLQISKYLDNKTQQIDTLVEKKQRQIELLKEYRMTVINNAVTKGLNPDVKMKDSGIEWLGEIPEHWSYAKIKRIVDIPVTDGPHETPDFYDDGVPFISADAIKNEKIDFNRMRGYISHEDNKKYSQKYTPKLGDIYMVKSGATTGNIAKVETGITFNIWSPLAVIRPNTGLVEVDFVFNFMKASLFRRSVELGWSYGTQQNIGMNVIENLYLCYPSKDEQLQISKYLDYKTKQIDSLIQKTENQIDKLKEYRTSLISEVVTGKVDVREVTS